MISSSHSRPRRLRRSLALGLGVLPALGASTGERARAASTALVVPYVRLVSDAPAWLIVRDESGAGSLVRVQLFDAGGTPLSAGEHPITVTRAVPPSERLEIDLTRFWRGPVEGSVRLSSNRGVSAVLRAGESLHPLIEPRTGAHRFELARSWSGLLHVAVSSAASVPAEASVLVRSGTRERTIARVELEAFAARLLVLPPSVVTGTTLVVTARGSTAVAILEDVPGAGLRDYGHSR